MKITKLLPLAVALLLVCPAQADIVQSEQATAEFSVTVPAYINITRTSLDSALTTTVTEIGADYSSLKLASAMNATFHVATNKKGDKVKLTGKCAKDTNLTLFAAANGTSPVLVFTNSTYAVDQDAINSAGAKGAGNGNPNAIAFDVTAVCANDGVAAHGGSITATAFADNVITYTLNNGEYNFSYTMPTTINNATFTTLDENGTYKAILYMDHVSS